MTTSHEFPVERRKTRRASLRIPRATRRVVQPLLCTFLLCTFLLCTVAAAVVFGCQSSHHDTTTAPPDFDERTVGLLAFDDCEDLHAYFKAETVADFEYDLDGGGHYGEPGIARGEGAANADATGAPQAPGDPSPSPGPGFDAADETPDFSRTNNQETEVDEPDIVKTDGRRIYVLRHRLFLIYDANDLSLLSETELTGVDHQLLIDADDAVILSRHWGPTDESFEVGADRLEDTVTTAISIYDLGDPAAPALIRRTYVEGELQAGRLTDRTVRVAVHFSPVNRFETILGPIYEDYDGGGAGSSSGGVPVDGTNASPPNTGIPEPAEPPEAQPPEPIEDGDGDDRGEPDEPGDQVEPIPAPEPISPPDADQPPPAQDPEAKRAELLAAVRDAVDAVPIDEWMPQLYDAHGDARETGRAIACNRVYRPGERAGSGLTTIISIDLDAPLARQDDPAVITAPGIVYASTTGLYLATNNFRDWPMRGGGGVAVGGDVAVSGGTTTPLAVPGETTGTAVDTDSREDALALDERQATQLHKFDVSADGGPAAYRASGRIYGEVLNQFSLGEHENVLRVATTERRFDDWTTVNHVFTLSEAVEADGGGRVLAVDGHVGDLAEGERIYAVRFIGDRGFVVTFRQVDPLFTLDLSDPANPTVVGELKVPGFSTYLHPIDDDHLLAIGQAADENGRVTGMQLSLFDVSDFAHPVLAHRQPLGQGWSEALYEHKALTWWPAESLLMVPVTAWDEQTGDQFDGLQLFTVSLDDGFESYGEITHEDLEQPDGQDGYWFSWQIERSLVIGETIYSVSDLGMKANAIADLSEAAQCTFPAGEFYGEYVTPGGTPIGRPEPVDAEPMPTDPAPEPEPEPDEG